MDRAQENCGCEQDDVQVRVLDKEVHEVECEVEEGEILEVVVIEEIIKTTKQIPLAHLYQYRVDRERYDTKQWILTGEEILHKAGKTPEAFKLYQHRPGQAPQVVKPDQKVDLREHGIERFTTIPRDTTEGEASLQRAFLLPAADQDYLNTHGFRWETVADNHQWLLIHDWQLPAGYQHSKVTLGFMIPPNYPDSQLDMVYVDPSLARIDNKPINALTAHAIQGRNFQRWSRHRTEANPWRRGLDGVATQLSLVDEWFRREFEVAQ